MNDKPLALLALLADGRAHSGAALAAALGITRGAVWARVQRLQGLGVDVHAVPGKGYRLPYPWERLDRTAIDAALTPAARERLSDIACVELTDSTNERLLQKIQHENIHGCALFAEYQTAGRGRRGDAWLAPPGSSLCLSLGWRFDAPPATMGALGLAIGVALAEAMGTLGCEDVGLKWPNDLLHGNAKLAGILIEMRAEHGGPSTVVVGVGLNLRLPPALRARIDQAATDMAALLPALPPRNTVAAVLLSHLTEALDTFAQAGFAPFVNIWARHDLLRDRAVTLELPGRRVEGIARGVDAQGLLLIDHASGREAFLSGHLRRA